MSRASEAALDALHAEVAKVLTAALKGKDPTASMVAQAINFLKANGIDAPARSERLTGLEQALEDLDLDDAFANLPN